MTDPKDDRFWNSTAEEMKRALHLHPLSDEEAAREYDAAPELPMSEAEIEAAAQMAKSRIPIEPSYAERTGSPDSGANAEIEREVGEVLGMHRNEGESDPEVEEEMRRQREEALRDDEEDETTNGNDTKKS